MHEAGIGEAVKVVVGKSFAVWTSIGFGNGETGAGDGFFNAETFSEATNKSSLAGANVADKFNNV